MLNSYLNRAYNIIVTRGYIEVEQLAFDNRSNMRGTIQGRLRFHDGSQLTFGEVLILRKRELVKLRYTFHYQDAAGEMIFRYDNAPHHPNLPTHPHHKHVGSTIESAEMPDLSNVLREIEQQLFPSD
jgi:hypothetical protein